MLFRSREDNGPVFAPSLRHRRRMRAMLANPSGWLRGRERPLWRQAVRRAAVFLVVCGMTLAGAMAFSPAARMAMVRWVVERSGNDIDYVYSGEQSPEALPQYEIKALPEGFVETERDVLPGLEVVIYENEIIMEGVNIACDMNTQATIDVESSAEDLLISEGLSVYHPDITPIREAVLAAYEQKAQTDGWDTDLMQRILDAAP